MNWIIGVYIIGCILSMVLIVNDWRDRGDVTLRDLVLCCGLSALSFIMVLAGWYNAHRDMVIFKKKVE